MALRRIVFIKQYTIFCRNSQRLAKFLVLLARNCQHICVICRKRLFLYPLDACSIQRMQAAPINPALLPSLANSTRVGCKAF